MKIKALHNHVVIKQDENQEQKYGNIVVADLGKEKPLQGEIVEIGPGRYTETGAFIPTQLKVGAFTATEKGSRYSARIWGTDFV